MGLNPPTNARIRPPFLPAPFISAGLNGSKLNDRRVFFPEAAKGVNLRNTLHLAYLLTPLCPPSGLRPNWEWLRSVSFVRELAPLPPSTSVRNVLACSDHRGVLFVLTVSVY